MSIAYLHYAFDKTNLLKKNKPLRATIEKSVALLPQNNFGRMNVKNLRRYRIINI